MHSIALIMINLINLVGWLIVILVIVKVMISYFVSPYYPARQYVDRLVEPLLYPIRRYIPPIGMFDFSPLVLIIIVQIIASLLIRLFRMLL